MSVSLGATPTELNLNDSTPATPSGKAGVKFQAGTAYPDPNSGIPVRDASAYVEPFMGSGASHAPGAVPDPGATAGTSKFLREDGSWVAPSGSGGAWTLIQKQILSVAAATVTFSSIPGSYSHLVLIAQGRVDDAAEFKDCYLQFNGDTGSNYSREYLEASATSPSANGDISAVAHIACMAMAGSTASSNMPGTAKLWIPNYSGTVFYKNVLSESCRFTLIGNRGHYYTDVIDGFWESTSAITQIDITDSGGGNFIIGSSFWLYGVD